VVEVPRVSLPASESHEDPDRDAILRRIRSALRDGRNDAEPADVIVPRDYCAADPSSRSALVDLFVERVREYKAVVHRVEAKTLSDAIAASLAKRGVKRLVVPADLPEGWAPPALTLLRDPGLTVDQIESSDGVLTGCALGIAQTGTIVLDSGPAQGRRVLTLLPDYHLCVVWERQVVGLVPEAVVQLQSAASAPRRPITFISGPSATSDIELNRVEGVHGPRTLEVLVVADGDAHHETPVR
jgi:L-lactate dehydrogenase complex protein LldG